MYVKSSGDKWDDQVATITLPKTNGCSRLAVSPGISIGGGPGSL